MTYEALARQVERVATRLAGSKIGPGERIAIVLPNGPEMAAVFLAIASVATCAPLNPAHKREEFAFYLDDLGARALVVLEGVESPAIEAAQSRGVEVLRLRADTAASAGEFSIVDQPAEGQDRTPRFAGPTDVALVLHTSGTTSRPKIVPLTHANLLASARHIREALDLGPTDRCLNVMPLFHIHGLVAALLASIKAGASVACCPGFDPERFFDWIEMCRPTWFTAVPTIHQAILDRADARRDVIAGCPFRFIRSCSSALPPGLMAGLERTFGVPVLEAYGMTEAAHQMTCNPPPPRVRKAGTVGLAAGPEVAIMGADGRLVPPGEVGEVVIRGPNLTRGYEDNPDANREAFVHGWFRTGDEGRFDAEGYLTITGRLKEMINRGGEKLAPREVDEALLAHPAVAQAVAFALPHPSLGEDVAAAVVLRGGKTADERELRAFVAGRLAGFKVPTRVLILEEIPKGPTGKIQRIGLADRLGQRLRTEYVAPRGPVEEQLAAIWAGILGLGRVGIDDDFFQSGGDSILATRLAARIRGELGVDATLAVVFESPTIRQLAGVIDGLRRRGDLRPVPRIPRLTRSR
jgi:acyl-CoA synthetase (AMP-forming)/AMP-acid ligase II